ncbi:MAG TPA: MoaD/ThiS family protein [bacterium]|nr:molybdenum cofactor biosynthesis protein MoaD [Candidatus Omnitrophota bacterium]HOJ60322.1 MoaD/ThiS family protein [bacterium]HOL94823.1 MoaD/ThiS family protein [bacterium]HPO99587.1 MoaD/ThiS family protein [bacterium]
MVKVHFPEHLRRHFAIPPACHAEGRTIKQLLAQLEQGYPGLTGYLLDERGRLRKHVNIFIGNAMVRDRAGLSDPVGETQEIHILQALSGG